VAAPSAWSRSARRRRVRRPPWHGRAAARRKTGVARPRVPRWIRSQIALLFQKDLDAASALAQDTVDIGRWLADADVEMLGVVTQARTLVRQGQTAEGMRLVDEAMAAAVSGRIGP
jgi:hypothetical protein